MARVTVDIEIPADIDTVWADVAELSSHVEWMADAESIEFMGEETSGVGTVMKVVTKVGPLQTNDIIRVVEWTPGESIGVHHEGLVTGTGAFHLEAQGQSTRFTWDEDLRLPWYFGGPIGAMVMAPVLRLVWRRNLRRLRDRFTT